MPIVVDNKQIETSVRSILEMLQQCLIASGIDRLADIEYKQQNATVTCPIHKNGHENTPSCNVLLTDKGDNSAGTVHCFGCGYRANMVRFVADCLDISYRSAKEWLLNCCDYSFVEDKRDVPVFDEHAPLNNYDTLPKITIEQLKSYDYVHDYMFKRKLTWDVINKYEVGYSPEEDCLTFPVYVDGECLFVAKRKVPYKRFIMPAIFPKPVYGLDYIKGNDVIVCESIINALTATSYGYEAIALFGTGSQHQYEVLNNTGIRRFILMFDGDEAGWRGAERFMMNVDAITVNVHMPEGRDVNDLSKEDFDCLLSNYL